MPKTAHMNIWLTKFSGDRPPSETPGSPSVPQGRRARTAPGCTYACSLLPVADLEKGCPMPSQRRHLVYVDIHRYFEICTKLKATLDKLFSFCRPCISLCLWLLPYTYHGLQRRFRPNGPFKIHIPVKFTPCSPTHAFHPSLFSLDHHYKI